MELIDIGVNLTHRSFNPDREIVIKEAEEAGVVQMILTGTSLRESRESADYATKYPNVLYSTAGVHPHDAKTVNNSTMNELKKLLGRPEVVAVGECGLDYDRDFSPRPVQRKVFEDQLRLAEETGKPLFLHERAAFSDFHSILSNAPEICQRAVVHCFTGTEKELEAYLKLGCFIGITGWICDERRGTELRKIVKNIPKDKLMIETDAPFLTPRSMRPRPHDGRNAPEYLSYIAGDLAKCRGESKEELAEYTTKNARTFFGLN